MDGPPPNRGLQAISCPGAADMDAAASNDLALLLPGVPVISRPRRLRLLGRGGVRCYLPDPTTISRHDASESDAAPARQLADEVK